MKGANRQPRHGHSGFTLMELMISLSVMSIIMVGMGSVLLVASHALPDANRITSRLNLASRVVNQMTEELQEARHIVEQTATAVTFTVPDRNGDGSPERIRYAWSGTAGAPLTREYNDSNAIPVLTDVNEFDLGYHLKMRTESYPGPPAAESAEILLSSSDGSDGSGIVIKKKYWAGQYFIPSLPAKAASWKVTRVMLKQETTNINNAKFKVQLYLPGSGNLPEGTELEQILINDEALPATPAWYTYTFSTVSGLTPGQGLCIALTTSSALAGKVYQNASGGAGYLLSTDKDDSWSLDPSNALLYRVYGTVIELGPDRILTRQYVTGMDITLQNGTEDALRLNTGTVLSNTPEVLSAVWEIDFDSDPTTLDINGDGVTDWGNYSGTFNPADLSNGIWYAPNHGIEGLLVNTSEPFLEPTTVDLRYRATSVGGFGSVFWIHVDQHDGKYAPIHLDLYKPNTSSQELWVGYEVAQYFGIYPVPDDFVQVRLVIDPLVNTLDLLVDGEHLVTHTYNWGYSGYNEQVWLYTDGCSGEFDYASIRVGGSLQ